MLVLGWGAVVDVPDKKYPAQSMRTGERRRSVVVGHQHRGGPKVCGLLLSGDNGAISCCDPQESRKLWCMMRRTLTGMQPDLMKSAGRPMPSLPWNE